MKKQQIYSILLVLLMILILPLISQMMKGSNIPFKNLKVEDIKEIELYLNPPDKQTIINDKEKVQSIVETLNTVVINKEESPNVDYDSQLVSFTLNKANDEIVTIKVYSPYIIIDEKIYKSDYETCDVLNLLGNDLLN